VTGGKHSVGQAIAEAVAREGADVVIWLRKCNDEVNEDEALPITLLEVPSRLPNGGASTSLWRPNNGAEILLVIRLGNASTSRLTLKDFWNKNAPERYGKA
jgi:NAD(P)-dependent dehydrogenase (short-subunit alcohol dehydrogenase family)